MIIKISLGRIQAKQGAGDPIKCGLFQISFFHQLFLLSFSEFGTILKYNLGLY